MVDKDRVANRLDKLHAFIIQYKIENDGISPSIREMGEYLEVKSTGLVFFYLRKLEAAGRIVVVKNQRRHISIPGGQWNLTQVAQ